LPPLINSPIDKKEREENGIVQSVSIPDSLQSPSAGHPSN
jgi:hypothetical protein